LTDGVCIKLLTTGGRYGLSETLGVCVLLTEPAAFCGPLEMLSNFIKSCRWKRKCNQLIWVCPQMQFKLIRKIRPHHLKVRYLKNHSLTFR
jgi:hypothetical protein